MCIIVLEYLFLSHAQFCSASIKASQDSAQYFGTNISVLLHLVHPFYTFALQSLFSHHYMSELSCNSGLLTSVSVGYIISREIGVDFSLRDP